jgi:hypothetical protein
MEREASILLIDETREVRAACEIALKEGRPVRIERPGLCEECEGERVAALTQLVAIGYGFVRDYGSSPVALDAMAAELACALHPATEAELLSRELS